MRTEQETRDKIEFLKSYDFRKWGWDYHRTLPISEVIKYGTFMLMWTLGELNEGEARYCIHHKKAYITKDGKLGCGKCFNNPS